MLSDIGIQGGATAQVAATVIFAVCVLTMRWLIIRTAIQRHLDPEKLFQVRKLSLYLASALVFGATLWIWSENIEDVGTFLGLASAGIAIALADVFLNLAGWIYIVLRRPFKAGDRIQVGDHIGDVIDIRIVRFTLFEIGNWVDADQPTGRLIHLPNATLFRQSMSNYTEGFEHIWHEISVVVTFESDWRRAEAMLRTILDGHHMTEEQVHAEMELEVASQRYLIRARDLHPTTYVDIEDSGVELTGRLLIHPRERRAVHDQLVREILSGIESDPTVELAYPTIRTFRP